MLDAICWFFVCCYVVDLHNILYEGRISGREFNPPMADKFLVFNFELN